MQRRRARRHRDSVGCFDPCREPALELGHPWTLRDPTGAHRSRGCFGLLGAEPRSHDRDRRGVGAGRGAHSDSLRGGRLLALPPVDEPTEPFVERDLGGEAEIGGWPRGVGEATGDRVHGTFRAVLGFEVGAHDPQECVGEVVEARLLAARDVVDAVGDRRLGREHVGPGDVVDVDEVHGLVPVAQDQAAADRRGSVPSTAPAPRCTPRGCPSGPRTR